MHEVKKGGEWYVVQTKSGQEYRAVNQLTNQGYKTYLPLASRSSRQRQSSSATVQAFFPGYLFVWLDLIAHNTAPIRSTRGVVGLVKQGNTLVPLPLGIVEGLVKLQSDGNGVIKFIDKFQCNDKVVINTGPLAGVEATFLSRCSSERVIILLSILGGQQQTVVSHNQVEKIT